MMTHDKAPTLLVNQSFNCIDNWSQAIGWDMDFRQIEPGLLNARAVGFGHAGIMVMRVELNRSFHQLGSPPAGFRTFGLPDRTMLEILLDVADWLLNIIIALAFLMIVVGGVMYISSTGNPERTELAKKTIIYAIIGLIIAGASYAAVRALFSILE